MKAEEICKRLAQHYWDDMKDKVERSNWHNAFRILISCLLSTRTKDEKTDMATKRLFSRFKTIEELANADEKEVEKLIYGVGFYKQKAKRVIEVAKIVLKEEIPKDKKKLMELPGIGGKCAGIVRAYAFGIPDIPVDTHVNRISQRLGLVRKDSKSEETEKKLKKIFPKECWIKLNHCMVLHGQKICKPIKPLCNKCFLKDLCEFGKNEG